MRIIKYSTSDSIVGNLVPTSFKSISKFNSKISCNSIRAEMNIPTSPVYATGDPSIFNSSTGFNPFSEITANTDAITDCIKFSFIVLMLTCYPPHKYFIKLLSFSLIQQFSNLIVRRGIAIVAYVT